MECPHLICPWPFKKALLAFCEGPFSLFCGCRSETTFDIVVWEREVEDNILMLEFVG